ncbi:MAG TPA: glutamate--tRNA ligase [Myxococcales bacterium]|nr:glutamate--tRNA ligase [Myxococcales bacterium]HIN86071.1 glutamate--tRNA ligase [Myxococcales bacterium]
MSVRVRIAPSPTGDPHVGTAYIGLFNMVWARKHGGQFILRIEDTDQTRSTPESEEAIMRSLKWVGLEWDEGPDVGGDFGPYRQSERTQIYQDHADQLIQNGSAYRCFCSAERLTELRSRQRENKENTKYDKACKGLSAADIEKRMGAGDAYTVRLDFPTDGQTTISDGLRGDVTIDNAQVDDQILLKSDGFPTYHLANVVDDKLMGITDVIRAEEWISSTPKHVHLYAAFGWEPPRFWHMPLLRNENKSKISKRKNPVSLDYYERIGILPEVMLNFLGRLGWSMPDDLEKFTVDEMIEQFTFDRVSLSGPVFDLKKLEWLNGLYVRDMDDGELVDRIMDSYLTRDRLLEIIPLLKERIPRLDKFVPMAAYMVGDDLDYPALDLVPKKKFDGRPVDVRKMLLKAVECFDGVRHWTEEELEAALRALADELEWKAGHVFAPVRTAISGRNATPPLFETMVVIGPALCRARVRAAAELLKGVN